MCIRDSSCRPLRARFRAVGEGRPLHGRRIMAHSWNPRMPPRISLHRWDEIALEKITEMISRKIVSGEREMLAQIYLKRGALVPLHAHESEQMTYILQGALRFLVDGEEIIVREGEVLHIPSRLPHQAEALEDTLELDVFSPVRPEWIDTVGEDDL